MTDYRRNAPKQQRQPFSRNDPLNGRDSRAPLGTVNEVSEDGHSRASVNLQERSSNYSQPGSSNSPSRGLQEGKSSPENIRRNNSAPRSPPVTNPGGFLSPRNSKRDSFTSSTTNGSAYSTHSFVPANSNDLLVWSLVFAPDHIGKTPEQMSDHWLWHVARDTIVFGTADTNSDKLLVCELSRDEHQPAQLIGHPELRADHWQLTPDGRSIIYQFESLIYEYDLEDNRISNCEFFDQTFETCALIKDGLGLVTITGDVWLWRKDLRPPTRIGRLQNDTIVRRVEYDWVRCHGSLESNWLCAFGQPASLATAIGGSAHVKAFGLEGNRRDMLTEVGIGAQIVMKDVYGEKKATLVRLRRDGQQYKLLVIRLYDDDETKREILIDSFSLDTPDLDFVGPETFIQLLVDEESSCMIAIFAPKESDLGVARIYDTLGQYRFIASETVIIPKDRRSQRLRSDSRGGLLLMMNDFTIQRLEINRTRWEARRAGDKF